MTSETRKRLLKTLDELFPKVQIVVVNQQLCDALLEKEWLSEWKALVKRHPSTRILVDARKKAGDFGAHLVKLNEREARELLGQDLGSEQLALESAKKLGCDIFLTRGDKGLVIAKASGECETFPAVRIAPPVDPVGAGDTTVAAIAVGLAGGLDSASAAKLATLAAAVTVRKINETGAPTPEEILALEKEADFIHLPDLAENPDRARMFAASSIEIVSALPENLEIRHAIFDHDGTLSTLRHGWESVMEPVMLRAILGKSLENATQDAWASSERSARPAPEKKSAIRAEVKRFIEETTGIQTLAQMQGLAALVKRCGCVPENEILDAHGYKKIYNDALMAQVNERRALLDRGDLAPEDFQIKNARALLEALKSRGIRLYLASGTDVADVKDEAKAMGYADLFDGGIYGAIGRVDVEAKREVMDRIQAEHKLDGRSLVVFGDGPVEIREGRRRGAACVGVGSQEASRHGLDLAKRTRLIRAGAHLVVPDFGSLEKLLQLLKLR
ncbi:MAG: HAD family hydrolase [Spirochaetia bacterium]|nr:HAD family hydrolase [Spirochaetia bacterium]